MLFSKSASLAAVAALSSLVSGQEASATAAAATPSGSVLVHVINAKSQNGMPVFDPPQVMANPGDLVQFHFWPMNHSVVQATFADPCMPISESQSGNGTVGFFSGFMPVSASATEMPTFTIEVNNTKPIWFYCSQGKHCQAGMVGAINPTAQKTLQDFQSRAAQAPENLSPGQSSSTGGSSGESGQSNSTGTSGSGSYPSTMATMTSGGSMATSTSNATAPPAGTNAAPGSSVHVSSAVAFVIAAVSAMLLV